MRNRSISFEQAKACFVHRYTSEHVPEWAKQQLNNGKYPAPQYATDLEWYNNTLFENESALASKKQCYSTSPSYPLGTYLDKPFV